MELFAVPTEFVNNKAMYCLPAKKKSYVLSNLLPMMQMTFGGTKPRAADTRNGEISDESMLNIYEEP
jgi:hypothetical protein